MYVMYEYVCPLLRVYELLFGSALLVCVSPVMLAPLPRVCDLFVCVCAAVQRLPDGRPRLNLKPRSAPAAEIGKPAPAAGKSSIFGGARPVDTAAREREIEERLRRGERGGRPRDRLSPQRRPPSGDDRGRRPGSGDRHDDRRPPARPGSGDRHDDRRPPQGRQGSEDRHEDRRPPPGRQGSEDRHDDRRPPPGRQGAEDDRRPPRRQGSEDTHDRRPPGRHMSEDSHDDRRPPGRQGSEDRQEDRRPPGRPGTEDRRPPSGRPSSEDEPRRREERAEDGDGEEELSYKQRRAEAYRDIRFPDGPPQKKTEPRRPPADSTPVSGADRVWAGWHGLKFVIAAQCLQSSDGTAARCSAAQYNTYKSIIPLGVSTGQNPFCQLSLNGRVKHSSLVSLLAIFEQ